jgi:hypothetical protein
MFFNVKKDDRVITHDGRRGVCIRATYGMLAQVLLDDGKEITINTGNITQDIGQENACNGKCSPLCSSCQKSMEYNPPELR